MSTYFFVIFEMHHSVSRYDISVSRYDISISRYDICLENI